MELSTNSTPANVLSAGIGATKAESFDSALDNAVKGFEPLPTGVVQSQNVENSQVKRPRGRPKKVSNSAASDSLNPFGDLSGAAAPAASQVATDWKPVDMTPMIKQGLKTPFKLWASKTGCKALELKDDEADTPAFYANELFNYYAPKMETMDPGRTALVMFAVSMFMLYGEKTAALAEYQESLKISVNASPGAENQGTTSHRETLEAPEVGPGEALFNPFSRGN